MIEYLPLVLTGIGIIASILYYTITLSNNNKTRQAQLFMQTYTRFQDPEFTKIYNEVMAREWDNPDDYREKYLSKGWDDRILSVQSYFEGIGVLLMKRMISSDFVYELMPTMVIVFWNRYEPIVFWVRENLNYPQFWKPVEYLKDKMIEEANKRGDPILLRYTQE